MLTGIPLLLIILISILLIVFLCAYLKLNPFVVLIGVSLFLGIAVGMPLLEVIDSLQSGFGGLMKYIGLVVVFGSIIGVFLEKSGGAMRIAKWILGLSGKKRSVSAMSVIGAIISVPVFCDSGFILLSGLTDRISKLASQNKASMSLALATGLYTTHTLVPPTPGPIAAAGNLGASEYLGTIILMGIVTSIPILLLSQFLARKFGRNIAISEQLDQVDDLEQQLPSLSKALLPIFIPIILIGVGTLLPFMHVESVWVSFFGNPLIALFVGAILAMILLKPTSTVDWKNYLQEAIRVAGPILIITGAGGAFGGVLKATPLSETVSIWLDGGAGSEISVLLLVFLIAAVLKTAQGSSTSAMVISSSLLAPLIPVLGWNSPIDFALAVMAIGGGAMTVSHYNDSYFWVVSQFGGLKHADTFRSFTRMTGIMGLMILFISICMSLVF